MRPETRDHRSQTRDQRSQVTDQRPETTVHSSQVTDQRPETRDHSSQFTGHRSQTRDQRPETTVHRSQITDHRSQVQNTGNIWYRIVLDTMLLYRQITGTEKEVSQMTALTFRPTTNGTMVYDGDTALYFITDTDCHSEYGVYEVIKDYPDNTIDARNTGLTFTTKQASIFWIVTNGKQTR